MRLILLLCLLLLAPTATAAAAAPTATTGAASAVGRDAATLSGAVTPGGAVTSWHFEYGTTTAYGLTSGGGETTAGTGPEAVSAGVVNLSAGTTYHYRLVATNADGTVQGADRTFRTVTAPALPGISSVAARQVGPTSASLRARIDPNRGATSFHFEYGRTSSFGSRTPERAIGNGDSRVSVAEAIGGLQPYRRYHYRVVATNEAGRRVSGRRTFTTQREPTAITLRPAAPRTLWGEGIEIAGRVSGRGVNGVRLAFERQDFPFAGPFSSIGAPAPIRANRDGSFRFFVPSLFSATRLRALTRTAVQAVSAPVTANVAVKVGASVRRGNRRAVRVRGSIVPAVPNGRAVLQRRTRRGSWVFVRGTNPRRAGENRSRYRFKVRKHRGKRVYRVRVIARDGGAHVPGTSRTVRVGALKRR